MALRCGGRSWEQHRKSGVGGEGARGGLWRGSLLCAHPHSAPGLGRPAALLRGLPRLTSRRPHAHVPHPLPPLQAAENVRSLMESLPPMRPLVMVLKVFLQQRELNEVGGWVGGLRGDLLEVWDGGGGLVVRTRGSVTATRASQPAGALPGAEAKLRSISHDNRAVSLRAARK